MTKNHLPEKGVAKSHEGDESGKSSPEVTPHSITESTRDDIKNTPSKPPETVPVKSEVLTSKELTKENMKEIADFFRYIFTNAWPQYVVCPPCDSTLPKGMKLSARQVYETGREYIPLEVMDKDPKIPDCPHCGEQMKIFHDPETTHKKIIEKLDKDGYVSLLRDKNTGKIAGFAFGYGCTLREEFENEWGNRYNYMAKKEQSPEYDRPFENFLQHLREMLPDANFEPKSEVFAWNCVATAPEARGQKNMAELMQNLFKVLPPKKFDLYIVGEVLKGSKAHGIFKTVGGRDVLGVLEGDDIITAGPLKQIAKTFALSSDQFTRLKKSVDNDK